MREKFDDKLEAGEKMKMEIEIRWISIKSIKILTMEGQAGRHSSFVMYCCSLVGGCLMRWNKTTNKGLQGLLLTLRHLHLPT